MRAHVCVLILCVCVVHTPNAPWLTGVLVIFFLWFPSCLPLCLSVHLSLVQPFSHYIYPSTACRSQSSKLSIHGASQHFEKVKAPDQSGLEAAHRGFNVNLFFFFCLPQSPLLVLLSCSQQAVLGDSSVWSHLTEGRTERRCSEALWEGDKLKCWYLAAAPCMWEFKVTQRSAFIHVYL